MLKLFKVLFVLMIFIPVQAVAEQYSPPPKIDKNYQIPSLLAEVNILMERFKLLEQRSRKLTKGEKITGDVDALLKDLYLPESATQFRRNYAREINVIRQPERFPLWLTLTHHYSNQGNLKDAATTAFMAYAITKDVRQKAAALALMGEIYIELGKLSDGLNIINKSLVLHKNNDVQNRLDVIKERFFLTIQDISVNVEQASPNACIIFSKKLKANQHTEDYVSVKGLSDIDINAKGNQICLNGLEYGKTYEVTVKRGLKGDNYTIMDYDSVRKFTVHDRESRASFENGSYVVSRGQNNVVSLTTINISHVNLTLYLIHDRNLIHESNYDLFEDINGYKGNSLKNELGSLIWQGEMDIKGDRNEEARTLIPLSDMIKKKENGIYILMAREPEKESDSNWRYRSKSNATQWLLVSDMGLMTFKGKDGLHVMVRSLHSAKPMRKVSVNLIARNNKILGTAITNKSGMAHFPMGLIRGKGGDAPVMITAVGKGEDYNFLKLQKSYLDLSERGVSGRIAPDKQDAFLYTDRGVYRPGETVKLSALLRDPENHAIGKLPITFTVSKPDGSRLLEKTVT
ncbi:MAG: hypothetical protein KAI89_01275, partial [Emcibacter sp.]|nr:hypothetical protein [Emcibacter sp.]